MDGTRQRTRLECNYLCNGCMCVCVCVCVCVCALRSMPWWVCSISPTQISAFDDISLKLVSVFGLCLQQSVGKVISPVHDFFAFS